MSGWLLLAGFGMGVAVLCAMMPARPTVVVACPPASRRHDGNWLVRGRPAWAGVAGLGPLVVLDPPWSWLVAGLVAGGVWWLGGRPGTAAAAATARARAELPDLVLLTSLGLRAGQPAVQALRHAAEARPGVAAARLGPHLASLDWGADPGQAWDDLAEDPDLAPLGRTLSRSHRTGAAVADTVARLARELAEERRAAATDRAHRVGVKAAVPLGLCLLPGFLLLGIVPMAAGLLGSLLR